MRSKYGQYPEYHTSLDDLTVISPTGLAGSYALLQRIIETIETAQHWKATLLGEPQLSRRGLRAAQGGGRGSLSGNTKLISDVLAVADGSMDTIALAELLERDAQDIAACCQALREAGLIRSGDEAAA
jgi:aminopeptidase-like protein